MWVYDVDDDEIKEVSAREAALGLFRLARMEKPGSPARAEMERHALDILRNDEPS